MYRYLDHMSDVYIECRGKSMGEAFEKAGDAMFNVMTDVAKVDPKSSRNVEVKGEDLHALLIEWLSELLYLYDTERAYYSKFKVHEIKHEKEEYHLKATIWGERIDEERHPPRTEVKAATYSLMEVKEEDRGVVLRFVLDI